MAAKVAKVAQSLAGKAFCVEISLLEAINLEGNAVLIYYHCR
jgi:hypothetical protein